jgi:hypothetical protein
MKCLNLFDIKILFKITHAEAGAIIAKEPTTLQLRYLQTLTEIASERNSTIIFPIPIDLLKPFLSQAKG